jgi:hypothetical protein
MINILRKVLCALGIHRWQTDTSAEGLLIAKWGREQFTCGYCSAKQITVK